MEQQMIEALYQQHSVGIYRFLLTILHSPQDAEDLTQETFLKTMKHGAFRFEPGKEKAFLYRVARNAAYNLLRSRKREAQEVREEGIWVPDDQDYFSMISCLCETDRQIVTLKLLAGATHAEIAKIMGISIHAAKKRYERAIARVRTTYEEEMK